MLEDLRKTIEATIGELTPARAKSLAKSLAGPGAAKDQVAKSATDLIEWSKKNRERLKEFIQREVAAQVGAVGVATQAEVETLKKRVRALERAGNARAAGSSTSTGKPTPAPAVKKKPRSAAAGASAKSATRAPRARS